MAQEMPLDRNGLDASVRARLRPGAPDAIYAVSDTFMRVAAREVQYCAP
jgi:hypothetical protein